MQNPQREKINSTQDEGSSESHNENKVVMVALVAKSCNTGREYRAVLF